MADQWERKTFQNDVETGVYLGTNEITFLPHTLYKVLFLDGGDLNLKSQTRNLVGHSTGLVIS